MPKTDPKFSNDIFYFDGFGQHIQVQADTIDELKDQITEVKAYLETTGATPRWNDVPKPYPSPVNLYNGPTPGQVKNEDAMLEAATATFGVQKLCPTDGTTMKFSPPGISKTKVDKNGHPKRFNSRYECPTCQLTVWNKD
jgi:hypothetical protein